MRPLPLFHIQCTEGETWSGKWDCGVLAGVAGSVLACGAARRSPSPLALLTSPQSARFVENWEDAIPPGWSIWGGRGRKDTHPLRRVCGTMAQTRFGGEGVWEGLRRAWEEASPPGPWVVCGTCTGFWGFFATPRGILVPQAGIEPIPPGVEAWRLNHWTARDVPGTCTVLPHETSGLSSP